MKRLAMVIILLAAGVPAEADFCMDCVEKYRTIGARTYIDALCCMADSRGECAGGYNVIVDTDVGWGCQTEVNAEGERYCNSFTEDRGCGGPGGGGGGGDGDDDCVADDSGFCPPECASCRPSI
ncbi:MAG TPA: hypothetical protein VGF48_04380 [Thermoanaerobaculia bacterium]|jgi:hypothetical protein